MKIKVYPTKNDIHEKPRMAMSELLNQQLADAIDLALQCKQAHWNVKGPGFFSLHELFDRIAGQVGVFTDEMAERAVELGGIASGTIQRVASNSRLAPYPTAISAEIDHVKALSNALANFAASTRFAIAAAEKQGDADTVDIFTEVSRGTDKLLWMVEAHLPVTASVPALGKKRPPFTGP
jgi:starvation-inducible DNA-binding protein